MTDDDAPSDCNGGSKNDFKQRPNHAWIHYPHHNRADTGPQPWIRRLSSPTAESSYYSPKPEPPGK